MPFGPFLSQEEKNKINNAMWKNAPEPQKPETPAERKARINDAVTRFFTPKGNQGGGAAAMMSGNPVKSKPPEPTAPPQAAKKPVPPRRGAGQNLPPSAAQPGTGPKGNEVGSDADTSTPGLQGPGAPGASGSKGKRVNANGLVSYGRDLSSLNAFTSAFTGGYELTDIKSAFQSNDLEGAYQNGSNTISTEDTKYGLPTGSTPSNVGGKYTMDGVDTSIKDTSYEITPASVPGTVGKDVRDPQSGASSKPDVAENIRQVRMRRKGPQ